jgi:hypothetical protein
MVIDFFGLTAEKVREQYPAAYQHVLERVKPERDQNNRAFYRDNWWLFGEARKDWRQMGVGLSRYIATVETSKHRAIQFLDREILPDNMLIAIALNDSLPLGVLSSRLHSTWALAAGGRLGVGNDPRYNKTRCFETFTEQTEVDLEDSESAIAAKAPPTGKTTFPKEMREQIAAVRQALVAGPKTADAVAEGFKRKPLVAVQAVLDALEELGMVSVQDGLYRLQS